MYDFVIVDIRTVDFRFRLSLLAAAEKSPCGLDSSVSFRRPFYSRLKYLGLSDIFAIVFYPTKLTLQDLLLNSINMIW